MNWQEIKVIMYRNHKDTTGQVRTLGQILFSDFGNNISDILKLRKLDRKNQDYQYKKKEIKDRLQCFTISALLKNRDKVEKTDPDYQAKMENKIISRTGLMQIDFDIKDCTGYDIEEMKQAVFSLPFIAFVSLSCSGDGFYCIAAIAEPEKLKDYALHIFEVLESYGISCDRGKGKNYNDLRYVSYDANSLWREDPEPLRIKHFKTKQAPKIELSTNYTVSTYTGNDGLIKSSLRKIQSATTGQRWQTVQQVAYTLGGLNDHSLIDLIKNEINNNSEFNGEESKYHKCADDCFSDGMLRPLIKN